MNRRLLEEQLKGLGAVGPGLKLERLHRDARLQHDPHVDGHDGWEFTGLFGKRFNVAMSEFETAQHFGPEAAFNPLT